MPGISTYLFLLIALSLTGALWGLVAATPAYSAAWTQLNTCIPGKPCLASGDVMGAVIDAFVTAALKPETILITIGLLITGFILGSSFVVIFIIPLLFIQTLMVLFHLDTIVMMINSVAVVPNEIKALVIVILTALGVMSVYVSARGGT